MPRKPRQVDELGPHRLQTARNTWNTGHYLPP
ncbi:hypothetical protein CGLO_01276 [Colletotrichum gloeosporioides Cg-14]|uniref:Uncharacterized protein n=1 Tax=Colletotrichum gloeosporioides (strain Cg-14) TaxID=1237896 RepID=T0KSK0_COLGC|nr:hypothetical protein CGLO_01276 [Colletotrichum gloeosporioides Cg-14]